VRTLLHRLLDAFAHGQIVFDILNSAAANRGNSRLQGPRGGLLKWAVDDLREVDALDPRLRRTATIPLLGSKFSPVAYLFVMKFSVFFPHLRDSMRMVRYEF
jgi:hypothetical protein